MKKIRTLCAITLFMLIFSLVPSSFADLIYSWNNVTESGIKPAKNFIVPVYDTLNDLLVYPQNIAGEELVYTFNITSKTWNSISSPGMPIRVAFYPMVYDTINNVTIFFGAHNEAMSPAPGRNETWAYYYETNTWINMQPPIAPPARTLNSMTFDSNSGKIIMFGGISQLDNPKTIYNDIWIYDFVENNWTDVTPISGSYPAARVLHSLTFDIQANRTIVFGGSLNYDFVSGPSGMLDDLSAYDLETQTWTERASHQNKRSHTLMCYDSSVNKHLLFGGIQSVGPLVLSDETWTYDYTLDTWTQLDCSPNPDATYTIGLVFNSKLNKSYFCDGYRPLTPDLWSFTFESAVEFPEFSEIVGISLLTSITIVSMIAMYIIRKRNKT